MLLSFKVAYDETVKSVQTLLSSAVVSRASPPAAAAPIQAAAMATPKPLPPLATAKPTVRKPPPANKPPLLESNPSGGADGAPPGTIQLDEIASGATLLISPLKSRAKPAAGTRRLPSRKPGGGSRGNAAAAAYRRPTVSLEAVGESTTEGQSAAAAPPTALAKKPPPPTPSAGVAKKPPPPAPTAKPRLTSPEVECAAVDIDESPTLSGWFVKKGRKAFDADRKRFFVLTPTAIRYFVDGGDSGEGRDLKGSIDLWAETTAAADDNRLMITNPDRNWVMTAVDAKDGLCKRWLEAVEAAVAVALPRQSPKVAPRISPKKGGKGSKPAPAPAPKGRRPKSAVPTPTSSPSPTPQSRPVSAPGENAYDAPSATSPLAPFDEVQPTTSASFGGPAEGTMDTVTSASKSNDDPSGLSVVDSIVASAANSDDEAGGDDVGGESSANGDALMAVDAVMASMGDDTGDDSDGENDPTSTGAKKDDEITGFEDSDSEEEI